MAATIYEKFIQNLAADAAPKLDIAYPSNHAALRKHLASEFKNSRFTLVLGAGVSEPSGLPSWSTVTNRLIKKIFQSTEGRQVVRRIQKLSIPEPRKIRFLEQSSPAFGLAVRDAIYERYTHTNKNKTLKAIARLAATTHTQKRFLNIITYNVDDLLEEHLNAIGLKGHYSVISCDKSYRSAKERVCIYHPHGYLPRNTDTDELLESKLVFSERQYHESFFDHTYWPNMIQRASFVRTTCLFVGCSLNDQNQRRLLDQSRLSDAAIQLGHAAFFRKSTRYRTAAQNMITDYITTQDVRSLGVEPYWLRSWDDAAAVLARLI